MKVYSQYMTSHSSVSNHIRRMLTSLTAIAAVSVIFGMKAVESQRAYDHAQRVAMTDKHQK